MVLSKALRHLVEHVMGLGPVTGLRVLALKKRGKGRTAVVRTPLLAAPLTVRTGTSDLAIFDEVVLMGGYDLKLDRPPAVIVDAGANIGLATLRFKALWPQARIIAVEPDPANFALLQRNVGGLPGVTVVQAALTARDGVIGLHTDGLDPSGFHVRELRPGEQGVPALCMRTLMQQQGLDHIDLLKLDIEGAEKELFEADDLGWMDQVRTVAIELHDRTRPGCGHAFFRAASRRPRNYEVHEYLVVATRT